MQSFDGRFSVNKMYSPGPNCLGGATKRGGGVYKMFLKIVRGGKVCFLGILSVRGSCAP